MDGRNRKVLDALSSSDNAAEFATLSTEFNALPECRLEADEWARALPVYSGRAACCGLHRRSVLHPDLDPIAAIAGQSVEWLAPRGSLVASRR